MSTNTCPCPIDATEVITSMFIRTCHWCEAEGQMYRYGTSDEGTIYWSVPLCSVECHDEFYSDDNWSLPVG